MSNFPQFEANTANIVPATEEIVYDKYWMTRLAVQSANPQNKTRLVCEFQPCREITTVSNVNNVESSITTTEIMPNGKVTRLAIEDVFGRAAIDPSFAQVMGGVLAMAQAEGKIQGVFKA